MKQKASRLTRLFNVVCVRRPCWLLALGAGLQWAQWWAKTSQTWQVDNLLQWLVDSCWDKAPAIITTAVLSHYELKSLGAGTIGISAA